MSFRGKASFRCSGKLTEGASVREKGGRIKPVDTVSRTAKTSTSRKETMLLTPPAPFGIEKGQLELVDPSPQVDDYFIIDVAIGLGSVLFETGPVPTSEEQMKTDGVGEASTPLGYARILKDLLGNEEDR